MTAVDQHAEAHRLHTEDGYGARRIAAELGITRHAATQLLARPLPQPVAAAEPAPAAEPAVERPAVAEPVAATFVQERPVAAAVAVPVAELADGRPPVADPRAEGVAWVAAPVGYAPGTARFTLPGARSPWLRVDLSGRPWLLRELVRLARVGLRIPYVVDLAVRSFAAAYHEAVTSGRLEPGQAYEVRTHIRPRQAA